MEYVERNREKQRERNKKLRDQAGVQKIVKPDELKSIRQIISGKYIITPYDLQSGQKIVKPDEMIVELTVKEYNRNEEVVKIE